MLGINIDIKINVSLHKRKHKLIFKVDYNSCSRSMPEPNVFNVKSDCSTRPAIVGLLDYRTRVTLRIQKNSVGGSRIRKWVRHGGGGVGYF